MLDRELTRLLARAGVTPRRSLGQSFLVNDLVARAIAEEAASEGSVLEIGAGLGALTARLLPLCGSLTAVEVSSGMAGLLEELYGADGLRVVEADFLQVVPEELPGHPFDTVAGNLPYSISSPVVFRLLEPCFSEVRKAVVMLQREVAMRAEPRVGTKDYGRMALRLWCRFRVRKLLDAEPRDFRPVPEVRSRVLVLERKPETEVAPEHLPDFDRLAGVAFARRRKTLLNNLAPLFGREEAARAMEETGIDMMARAEQVPPETMASLALELA